MNEQLRFLIDERIKTIKERLQCLGMTHSTIKTYSLVLKSFFQHIEKINDITEKEVEIYLDYLIIKKKYMARSRNLVAKIIKFYFREFFEKEIKIARIKENKPIPNICWDNDFRQIISVTTNIKHRICLLLMRYSGLRRWEVIRVMKHHIQSDGKLLVKCGKGQKDRYTLIPPQVLDQLNAYISLLPIQNPYLFPSQDGTGHYSSRTPQAILINAFKDLKWHRERWFGCHALRHAFCVYCLDEKIGDYDQVSKWLGHSVKQTTQIYTQCIKADYVESIERYKAITCFIQ